MALGAKVDDIDVIARFRVALIKFAETAGAALGDAEGDISRTQMWLENEQQRYWTTQIRIRTENVAKAQDALRQKKLFKDSSGNTQSAVEEMKQVQIAQRKLVEAQEKLKAVRDGARKLQKEGSLFKGQVQRLATSITSDVPAAIAHLGALVDALRQYAAIEMGSAASTAIDPATAAFFNAGAAGMSRGTSGGTIDKAADDYAKLRQRTPSAPSRLALPQSPEPLAAWTSWELPPAQRELISALPARWATVEPTDKVVLGPGVAAGDKLFLERIQGPSQGDSGWYIGTVAPPGPGQTIGPQDSLTTVEQVLKARPDFNALLTFPPACLLIVDASGVVAVLDETNQDIWATALAEGRNRQGQAAAPQT